MHLVDAGVAHPVERHLAKVEVASSSLVTRSKKEVTFVYQKLLLFLSKPQAWHNIAAQSAVHIISRRLYFLRLDDIQNFVLMICNFLRN